MSDPVTNTKPKPEPRRKPRIRRSRSSDSERGRRSERGGRSQQQRRGRSEEPRRPEDDECAVCFCSYDNAFRTPKLLACGHTFCLECLARINVASPPLRALPCPLCREITRLPRGRDLPRLRNDRDVIGRLPPDMRAPRSVRFQRSKGKLLVKDAAGGARATVVDVGRPAGRVRRGLGSNRCYYLVVAAIVTIAVGITLGGILAFAVIPHVTTTTANPTSWP